MKYMTKRKRFLAGAGWDGIIWWTSKPGVDLELTKAGLELKALKVKRVNFREKLSLLRSQIC